MPFHVLGDHSKCKPYFCQSIGQVSPAFTLFKNTPAGKELLLAFHRLANRSQRLIYNTTSNYAECFMSIMTKCLAGKRINFAQRGSYGRRTHSAVMAYNVGAFWLSAVFPPQDGNSRCRVWDEAFEYFQRTNTRKSGTKRKRNNFYSSKSAQKANAKYYGTQANQGTLSTEELAAAVQRRVTSLQVSRHQLEEIERSTVGQCLNERWKNERRNRLTASNCGRIYSLQLHTSNLSILKSLLYPTDLSKNENIRNGINLEPEAKRMYAFLNGVEVKECGLFVWLLNGILAASPDGLIGIDGLVEIKCITCKPNQVPGRSDRFLVRKNSKDDNSELMLRKTHKYFYQILMQLYVTGRDYCDLFVYYKPKDEKENIEWFQERISRNEENDKLWEKVSSKLIKFYTDEVAPEIENPVFHQTGNSGSLSTARQLLRNNARKRLKMRRGNLKQRTSEK